MANTAFCVNRDCEYRLDQGIGAKMTRVYIREHSDQEYKSDRPYKRMKQYFKPIGWTCPYCKQFILDQEFREAKTLYAIPKKCCYSGTLSDMNRCKKKAEFEVKINPKSDPSDKYSWLPFCSTHVQETHAKKRDVRRLQL